MEIFLVGTSHAVAPLELRERLHVDPEQIGALADALIRRGVLAEVVPLATCGRLELYAVSDEPDRALRVLVRLLARQTGIPRDELRERCYALRGARAVRHLFRVASGLDSVVHGEAQILGQVREAAHRESASQSKGPILHRLFDVAIATGKRVRTETEIGRGAASLASAALEMVRREVAPLESLSALVLGAGETGSLMAHLLRKGGVGHLTIANRTEERAQDLADALGAEAAPLSRLTDLLRSADLVVGAVSADDWIVSAAAVARIAEEEPHRIRHFLDLAHPRNFDPGLRDVPSARVFDLEHVFERVEAARAARAAQVPRAESIVRDQARSFTHWLRSRESVTVLRAVRDQVLDLARAEADRFGQGRTEVEREEMRRFARSLARTLLHPPTMALRRADPRSPEGRSLLESATALFGLDDGLVPPGGPS